MNPVLRPAALSDLYRVRPDGIVIIGVSSRYEALRTLFLAEWQKRGYLRSP